MPELEVFRTEISGCYRIQPTVRTDSRGYFVKTFIKNWFGNAGLRTDFVEEYHSQSCQGVIRGLHFQRPPHQHVKLVYCLSGSVIDAVVDLRKDSLTYGQHRLFELSSSNATMLYIPAGLAHGFEALEDNTLMVYKVTSGYVPSLDDGIRWDSAGIPWHTRSPILSPRDQTFTGLSDFDSPFLGEQ